jgi:drug/metabolite transporter (DMT)-like permease
VRLIPDSKSPLFAEGLLAFNTIVWGGTYIAIKFGLEGMDPFPLVAVRYLIASAVLLPFLWRPGRAWRASLPMGLLLGFFLFIGIGFQTRGLVYTTAAKSGFITGMFVVFTPFLHWLLNQRRPRVENYVGIALVLAGLFLLTWPARGGLSGFNLGDGLTVVSALGYSFYIVYMDRVREDDDTTLLIFYQMFFTAVLAGLAALVFLETGFDPETKGLLSLAYLILPGTLLMVYIQTRFQNRSNPIRAAIIYSLEPVFAAAFAWWLLSEQMTTRGFVGAGLMLIGVIVSETWKLSSGGPARKAE